MATSNKGIFAYLEYTAIIFGIIVAIVFGFVLLWISDVRYEEYHAYHKSIATQSTHHASIGLGNLLRRKTKLVETFLEDNIKLIEKLTDNPQEKTLHENLDIKLGRYFLDYFSSSIADADGNPIIDDFDGNFGQLCIEDLKYFAKHNKQLIRLHPHPEIYHFDILVRFKLDLKYYTFFVSFKTNEISQLLKATSPIKHKLLLVYTKADHLIEITADGNRINMPNRDDFHLTDSEKTRTLASFYIPNTRWNIIDLHNPGIFSDYKNDIENQSIFIYLFFAGMALFMGLVTYIGIRKLVLFENSLMAKNLKIETLNNELRNLNDELEEISVTDKLTGIKNRRYLDIYGIANWNRAQRLRIPLHIALIDIDFFKQYNDTYGHLDGDQCLINLAKLLDNHFKRANEFVSRFGGEEFIILNTGDDTKTFVKRLEAFMETLRQSNIEHRSSSISQFVTVSIGVASSDTPEATSLGDIIRAADTTLYKAKDTGRNKIVVN